LKSEDLLYAQLFVDTLKQLSTSKMNYTEINQKIQNVLGSLACGITCLKHYETHEAKVYFYTSFSAIEENVRDTFKLLYELLEDTKHTDEKRLFEYLC
jgi:Zn-dependent M16 (insulinase) family peptidase